MNSENFSLEKRAASNCCRPFSFLFEKESGAETTKLATEYKIKQVQMSTHFRILQVSNSLKGPLSIIDFLPALLVESG